MRMLLVLPVVLLMLNEEFEWALVLFIIAGISDAIDGYIAKQFNWVSGLGKILDPLADKLLMLCCYLVLGWLGYVPLLLVSVVITRDFLIVLAAMKYKNIILSKNITPTVISKVNTTAQILLICVVLFSIVVVPLSESNLNFIFFIVYITTLASALDYVFIWKKQLINSQHRHN